MKMFIYTRITTPFVEDDMKSDESHSHSKEFHFIFNMFDTCSSYQYILVRLSTEKISV